MAGNYETIGDYVESYPKAVRAKLEEMRQTIRRAAPGAVEVMSYRMPALKQQGILVWFGAFKNHIGFYPKASGVKAFQEELSQYRFSKGAVQFPLDKPIPWDLVKKIVEFRVKENLARKEVRRTP